MSFASVYSAVLTLNSHILTIIRNQKEQMATLSDISTAVTTLANNFASLDAVVQSAVTAIQAAQAANDQATLTKIVSNLSDVSAKMTADASELSTALTPAPAATTTPAPAATPAPAPATPAPAAATPAS